MAEELLEKIPPEKRWAIAAKTLTRIFIMRGTKTVMPLLGIGEGIISPVMGWEKYVEITEKIWTQNGRRFIPRVKEIFNISVEDSFGAAKLYIVASFLVAGPEDKYEIVEETRERIVIRWTQCGWWEGYKELKQDSELTVCYPGHQIWAEEGLKIIDPKLSFKLTKARQRGDPYCEAVIEFKEV